LLKRFEEEVKVKSIIHFETYKYFQKLYYILNYPALFISFMINSALFTRMVENNANTDIFLIGNIITIICNIIIGLVSYYKIDDRMNIHLQYSMEYTRIYRMICQFYYENLVMKDQLKKEILFYFLENIKSHIFLLIDDEPKCPSHIVHNVKIKNVDICFYVYSSINLKHPYSYDNVLKLYQLSNDILLSIMNEIETNPQIHIKYPGFYRFNIWNENFKEKKMPKKDILNYIILEKNILYQDILDILKNNENSLKTIHCFENEYDKIFVKDRIQPNFVVINMDDNIGEEQSNVLKINTNLDNLNETNIVNTKNKDITPKSNVIYISRNESNRSLNNIELEELSNSLIETKKVIEYDIHIENKLKYYDQELFDFEL
jgi:hypothetical protein